jgi:anaerobic selenocysteine-containing dehydrogenase
MVATHQHICTLCEATCGITVTTDGDRVTDIRGDVHDPISRGYICPKATALADLHHDPDRLRRPLVKRDGEFAEVSWREALDLAGDRLRAIRAEHGKHALGVYYGNPAAHNLGLMLFGIPLFHSLGTRNVFAATSVDQLPPMLAAYLMLGHQGLLPVPDIDRTELFVCIGANPLVSNGSLMTAPNMRGRLKALRKRGGRVVVIDPRRTETAAVAEHVFIRPGTDALMLLSLVNVLFEEDLVRPGRLAGHLAGTDALRAAAGYPPERTTAVTGVTPETVRELARALAATERAVLYARVGACTQEFGGLASWLVLGVNVLTGHLDEPGGCMFTTPAIDLVPLAKTIGQAGSFAAYRSRVRGLPARALALRAPADPGLGPQLGEVQPGGVPARGGSAARLGDLPGAGRPAARAGHPAGAAARAARRGGRGPARAGGHGRARAADRPLRPAQAAGRPVTAQTAP